VILSIFSTAQASANEKCETFDLGKTFNFGFVPEFPKWTKPGESMVISWATFDSGELNGKRIQIAFSTSQREWLRESFQSWDEALDSITFQEVSIDKPADIKIAWTQVLQLDYESLFSVEGKTGFRRNATIELKSGSPFLLAKENFIQVVQSDIGHILGMGYISPSSDVVSVMEWPFQSPYGQMPLGRYDVALIRSIYSESTCPSTFSLVIQAKIKELEEVKAAELARIEAEIKAADELKIRKEEIAKAAEELAAKGRAEVKAATEKLVDSAKATADKIIADAKVEAERIIAEGKVKAAQSSKKVTITCIKGKLVKKVTSVKPVCPAGYKKK
jgi:hypothetical protein